jgi:hypothetical protein
LGSSCWWFYSIIDFAFFYKLNEKNVQVLIRSNNGNISKKM